MKKLNSPRLLLWLIIVSLLGVVPDLGAAPLQDESHGAISVLSEAREEISLNGTWEIVFDDHNQGAAEEWQLNRNFLQLEQRRPVEVPGAWERVEKDYEGVAFYRKVFSVPGGWSGKVVRLHFGAVNYRAEVWLNDEVVGFHEGGFTPFEFRVDEMLNPGEENVLTLRVLGPIMLSSTVVDGIGPMETPQWRGGLTGGIWQPVRLVATEEVYIRDVFIEPKLDEKMATFHVQLNHTGSKKIRVDVVVEVGEGGREGASVAQVSDVWKLRPGDNRRSWSVSIPEVETWSPESPHLYEGEVTVAVGADVSDHWSHSFGMRKLTIQEEDFYLNGEPIYIKAAFFEGLYPTGIAYPDSEAMARRETHLAKEAGFNMIRPWRHPPAPMWLDLADEMGVMVVGSPAVECMDMPASTPYLPSRVADEICGSILRDRNRASVVQWELFNELRRPILKQMMRSMALLARELDPTRLILDESGGWAFGAQMYLPYEFEPIRFNDIHTYPGPFINERLFEGFLSIGLSEDEKRAKGLRGRTPGRNVVPGLMSFVSELGYGSLPNLVSNNERFAREGNPLTPAYRYHRRLAEGQRRMLQESGFGEVYPELEQFCLDQQAIHGSANKRMIEAVRSNPRVDGYCVHALSAGDWILGAGLVDLWRDPKSFAYEATKAANQPRILPIRVLPRNVYAKLGASLEVVGVNELEGVHGELLIRIRDEKEEVLFEGRHALEWASGIQRLLEQELETGSWRGPCIVEALVRTTRGAVLAQNTYRFDVFSREDLVVPRTEVGLLDLSGSLSDFLDEVGVPTIEFTGLLPISTPVLVTSADLESETRLELFGLLFQFVRRGGTAVYVEGVETGEENSVIPSEVFPFSGFLHPARGLWTCIPHLVHDHPIFAGLPRKGMMRDLYQNVWPTETIRELEGEPIVASIGFDWFSEEHELHYSGPGESWWGSDVALLRLGKGRVLVSQLRIVENLGQDPVADKLLLNMIRFVAE